MGEPPSSLKWGTTEVLDEDLLGDEELLGDSDHDDVPGGDTGECRPPTQRGGMVGAEPVDHPRGPASARAHLSVDSDRAVRRDCSFTSPSRGRPR